jgi:hypothetical protein
MRKPKKVKLFQTEADLCHAFIGAVDPEIWTAYAETHGWDILLVRAEDGFQIGIQAKLRLTTEVFAQAIEEFIPLVSRPEKGPDCRAVLVPANEIAAHLGALAAHLGVTVIRMAGPALPKSWRRFSPDLPLLGREWAAQREWFELAPEKRHDLPAYVPDVAAGVASPVQLTRWKIGALKIAILLAERGFVTRRDFRLIEIDVRRWLTYGWLIVQGDRLIRGPACPDFAAQHPKVYAQIAADGAWRTPPAVEPDQQKEMVL